MHTKARLQAQERRPVQAGCLCACLVGAYTSTSAPLPRSPSHHPICCVRRSQPRLHALKRTSARTPTIARPGQGARACAACRAPVAQYHVTSGRLRGAPGSKSGVPRPDACSVVPRLASGPVLEPLHPQGNSPRPWHLWRQSKPPVSDEGAVSADIQLVIGWALP